MEVSELLPPDRGDIASRCSQKQYLSFFSGLPKGVVLALFEPKLLPPERWNIASRCSEKQYLGVFPGLPKRVVLAHFGPNLLPQTGGILLLAAARSNIWVFFGSPKKSIFQRFFIEIQRFSIEVSLFSMVFHSFQKCGILLLPAARSNIWVFFRPTLLLLER